MDRTQEFIESFLGHAQPQFYDPAKAHEYYLKNRELKGRQSGASLKTEKKKEAWEYSKSKINEAKGEESTAASEANKAAIEKLRGDAKQYREAIGQALKSIMEQISFDRKDSISDVNNNLKKQLQKITEDTQAKIDALPPVPKGNKVLAQKRREELAKIRGESAIAKDEARSVASEERAGISDQASSEKEGQREAGRAAKEEIGNQLKADVETARANYETLKEDLKAKYEGQLQTEYDAIKALR